MKKIFTTLSLAILLPALASCATVFSGSEQNLHVKVVDEASNQTLDGSRCEVKSAQGGIYPVYGNPGVVTVSKSEGSLRVECHKDGYRQTSIGFGQNFNAVSFVNVLFWPGFIVDGLSGAYKKYPSHAVVRMARQS